MTRSSKQRGHTKYLSTTQLAAVVGGIDTGAVFKGNVDMDR